MSLLDRINSVQALALAGLERSNSNVSMIQNIRITTGQILNFAGQVRSEGLNINLQIPDLSVSYSSPFYYAFDGVEESYPLTGSETIAITKMSDDSIRFNLRDQYVLTSSFSNFQNITLPNIITTNENQNTLLSNLGNTILSFLQTHEFNTTIANHLLVSDFNNYSSNINLTINNIISVNNTQNTLLSNINNTLPSYLQSATASSTYQPLGDYLTTPNFNTIIQDYATISMVSNKVLNYLLIDNFNTFSSNLNSTLSSVFATNVYQDTLISNISNTLPALLKTTIFDNYTGSANSTFGTIITNINNIDNTLPSYLQTLEFNNYKITLNSTLTSIINKNDTQDTSITNINNTITSFLQLTEFDNYKNTLNSTLTSIINKNNTQDQHITNITAVLPLLLSIDTFNLHIENNNATFGTVLNKNNSQDTSISNLNNTITSFLQTSEFDNYKITLNSTLTSIINKNDTQDTNISNIINTLPSYLQTLTFNNYTGSANSTFGTIITNINNINNTIPSYLQTSEFDNYKITLNSTLTSIINKNDTQDTNISNIINTLPSYLQTLTFNNYTGSANSTFGTIITNINNINNTLPSYLQTLEFDNYKITLNSTLTSIINTNTSQDTSINNILTTLPSYLQSATASSTYQPVGDYALNNTLNNYSSNVSFTINNIISINTAQSASINSILTTIPSYLQSATADATFATIANPVFTGTLTAPTVNATTILQINGTSTNTLYASKPWVQCVVNAGGSILSGSSVGRVTPTITRTSGQAVGALDISFTAHPNSFNYTHYVQVRTDSGLGFGVVSNVSGGSLKVRLYNSSHVLTDYQFSLVIFA